MRISYILLVLFLTCIQLYAKQIYIIDTDNIIRDQHDSSFIFIGSPPSSVEFELLQKGIVSVDVFDINGKVIKQLFIGMLAPGWHKIIPVTKDMDSGVYIVRVMSEGKVIITKKIIVLK